MANNKHPFLIRFEKQERELLTKIAKMEVRNQNEVIIDALYTYDYLMKKCPESKQYISERVKKK